MDGQTDRGDYNIPFTFLKKRGDKNGKRSTVTNVSDCRSPVQSRAQSHTFVEIDHEIISTVILLPSECCQLQANVCAQSTG